MKADSIARFLESHGVPYYYDDGRIYADTMEAGKDTFDEVEDLTGYGLEELRDWMGY